MPKPAAMLLPFALGLWLGWSMSAERLCGVRPTVPLLLREITITLVGE
jgi:hypothetical protein